MNLTAGFIQADGISAVIAHENVSVTQGMKAILNSTDSSYTLEIDTNGDGQVDQSRSPDIIERVFANQLYLPLVTK